jgi:hypothetical protein
MDAVTQLHLGDITTALVTGNDELTPSYFRILQRAGYLGQLGQVAAAGASMAMMLTTTADGALCEVESVGVGTLDQLPAVDDVDGMVLGTNGLADNDAVYEAIARQKPDAFRFDYKRLFGEGYSASALGLYAAAHLVAQGKARRMLFVNHGDGLHLTYVILRRVS